MDDLTQIWIVFENKLLNFIKSKINCKEDARDILQEVFLKMKLNIAKLQNRKSLTAWMYAIARNSITDFYRSEQNEKKKIDYAKNNYFDENPEAEILQELTPCIEPFIARLKKEDQDLLLQQLQGNKQIDLAKKLNLPYSTLKSKMQQARMNLKNEFLTCCTFELNKDGAIHNIMQKERNCKQC